MIGFAGLSHLGIVSSAAAAAKGFSVVCYDQDAALCADLSAGRLPILEPGLDALIGEHRGRLKYTAYLQDLTACSLIYISRDIPTNAENQSDVGPLIVLLSSVLEAAPANSTVVILSQVSPGFTRQMTRHFNAILKSRQIQLLYQVETLIFGRAVERAMRPERYMIGTPNPRAELPKAMAELLGSFQCPVFRMRYESAELAKIAINFFLVSSVTTTNTLAELCEAIGADWSEIAPTLRLDARIGPHAYLGPGLGLSGGNLERDLATYIRMAAEHGVDDSLPQTFLRHSVNRKSWVLRTLHRRVLSKHAAPVIAVWGLAYKPNTHSTKNAPTLHLLEGLRGISIRLYDPQAKIEGFPNVEQTGSALDACKGAHALVIMTAWEEFKSVRPEAVASLMADTIVLDPSASWSGMNPEQAGLCCFTLGKTGHRQT